MGDNQIKSAGYEISALGNKTWSIYDKEGVYLYLVAGDEKSLLIDTGFGAPGLKDICGQLTALPMSVVITHGHLDHFNGNCMFGEVYCHPSDFCKLRESSRGQSPLNASYRLLPVWEGSVFELGNRNLEVICAPGHTPGGIVLLDRQNRILFAGDTPLDIQVSLLAHKDCSIEAYLCSLKRIEALSGHYDTIWTSHNCEPLTKSYLKELILLCAAVIDGSVEGIPTTVMDLQCKLYKLGSAELYY